MVLEIKTLFDIEMYLSEVECVTCCPSGWLGHAPLAPSPAVLVAPGNVQVFLAVALVSALGVGTAWAGLLGQAVGKLK